MTIAITLGWWMLPAFLTLASFIWLAARPATYSPMDPTPLFVGLIWLVGVLAIWLAYFIGKAVFA